jgi:cellulose biosynthesis protein BcsQ
MDSHGTIITFYSYKGGVGRTMMLANVAWILASNGRRVLVVDWDLEAPGLHRYFHPFLVDKDLTTSDGIIDFVLDFAAEALTPTEQFNFEWHLPYTNILRYASSLEWEFPNQGSLDFVPAGRQGIAYATRVNGFNWQNFYERYGGRTFFEAVKEKMRMEYDYILIDSRTGISDTAGITTIQMPDILVACFTFNHQNIEGISTAVASVDAQRRKADGQPEIRIFPVPMRVEMAEMDMLHRSRTAMRKRFDAFLWHLPHQKRSRYWTEVEIPYTPFYAYSELLAAFAERSDHPASLLAATERLTGYLTYGKVMPLEPIPEESRLTILQQYKAIDY